MLLMGDVLLVGDVLPVGDVLLVGDVLSSHNIDNGNLLFRQ